MFEEFRWTKVSAKRNAVTSAYEPIQPFVFRELARQVGVDTFFDIGANIGLYTILVASMKSVGRVHSFEPTEETFTNLVENVRLNGLEQKVLCHKVVLSDSARDVPFGLVGDVSGANGVVETTIHDERKFRQVITCRTQPLDAVVHLTGSRIAIKLDVEGHELSVLRGARGLLEGNRGFAQIEVYDPEGEGRKVIESMEELSWPLVLRLGPDHYFTNEPAAATPQVLKGILECAASAMIAAGVARFHGRSKPVRDESRRGSMSERLWRYLRSGRSRKFQGSASYWERRYARGGNSGPGSYCRLANFKARVLNDFVARHGVRSVIEFGCGDGNQLTLACYEQYLGFDIAATAIEACMGRFPNDPTKQFRHATAYAGERAELALSLDVIYHLVEDEVFDAYMQRLFGSAEKYVIIYASNDQTLNRSGQVAHVRHRKFSDWIDRKADGWALARHIPNDYPSSMDDPKNTSFADFYIYERLSNG